MTYCYKKAFLEIRIGHIDLPFMMMFKDVISINVYRLSMAKKRSIRKPVMDPEALTHLFTVGFQEIIYQLKLLFREHTVEEISEETIFKETTYLPVEWYVTSINISYNLNPK